MNTRCESRNVPEPQRGIGSCWIRWLGGCSIGLVVWAGAVQAREDGSRARSEEPRNYAYVVLGGFSTDESAQILDHSTGGGSFGAGFGWGFHRYLTFELDANMSSTSYEMPPSARSAGARSDFDRFELSLSTSGVLGNVKLARRFGRVIPHVGVGLGFGLIDVSVSDSYSWGYAEPLASELSVLTQVMAGFDVRVGRRSTVGIEYRELFAHRTIDFAGEEVDGGGENLLFAYRLLF